VKKQILGSMILILLSVVCGFGQKSDKHRTQSIYEQEQEQKKQDELVADGWRVLTEKKYKPGKNLLPDTADAWVLRIVTTGGFDGKGLPMLTIKSDGKFACGESETTSFKTLSAGDLMTLSKTIKDAIFEVQENSPKLETPAVIICNDCYLTNIYLLRREANGKNRFFSSAMSKIKYLHIAENFNLIKQNVSDLAACQN
jgi:hypothetical protein